MNEKLKPYEEKMKKTIDEIWTESLLQSVQDVQIRMF